MTPVSASDTALSDTASPVPTLLAASTAALGPKPDPAQLAAGLFDLRRDMVARLLRLPALPQEGTNTRATAGATLSTEQDMPLTNAQEDILRDTLPPLQVSAGPYTPVFSAWRGALAAVLGLIFGSALVQGVQISGIWAVLGGMTGVGAALWLADNLAHARATGLLRCFGRSLRWKHVRRWGTVIWWATLVLTLLRDFLQQNPALEDTLAALTAFLTQGAALPLLQNMYWLLGFIALFVVATHRPVRLDMAEYHARLHMVAQTWWDSALIVRDSILAQYAVTHSAHSAQRQKAVQELYSFAAELPVARARWLHERLDSLGFSTPKVEGELRWEAGLASTYDVVGHVTEGDCCFVDTPPLMDGEQLVRKGTLRKIRTQA